MRTVLAAVGLMMAAVAAWVPAPVQAATSASVNIVDFAFQPATVTLDYDPDANLSITFTYGAAGQSIHQAKSDPHNGGPTNLATEGSCLNMATIIFPNQTTTVPVTVDEECLKAIAVSGGVSTQGLVVKYHCHIHAFMTGSIVLKLA